MALGTSNISTTLVRDTLGASTNKVGELCSHANVNLWAKHKPVPTSDISVLAADVGYASGTYGLTIPTYNDTDTQIWTYNKPTGGSTEPFRLGDFRGYAHTAPNPVNVGSPPQSLTPQFDLTFLMTTTNTETLSIEDFDSVYGTLRMGVEVRNSLGNVLDWASASSTTASISVDVSGYTDTSTISLRFFLVDVYKAWGDTDPGGWTRYSLSRETTTENQFWVDVPVDETSSTDVEQFDVAWLDNEITVRVDTVTYTGDAKVEISRTSDLVLVSTVLFTIPNTSLYEYTEANTDLADGTEYEAVLFFWDGTAYYQVATFTWTTFGSV